MKLFLLKRVDMTYGYYDQFYGFVIRAENEEKARELASKESADEGLLFWKDRSLTICEELLPDGPEDILIRDFHAG